MSKKSRKDPVQVRGRRRDALKVAGVLIAVVVTLFVVMRDSLTLGLAALISFGALVYFLMAMWNWSTMDYTYDQKDAPPEAIDRNLEDVEIEGINDGDSVH